jgi:hypothetical protein
MKYKTRKRKDQEEKYGLWSNNEGHRASFERGIISNAEERDSQSECLQRVISFADGGSRLWFFLDFMD